MAHLSESGHFDSFVRGVLALGTRVKRAIACSQVGDAQQRLEVYPELRRALPAVRIIPGVSLHPFCAPQPDLVDADAMLCCIRDTLVAAGAPATTAFSQNPYVIDMELAFNPPLPAKSTQRREYFPRWAGVRKWGQTLPGMPLVYPGRTWVGDPNGSDELTKIRCNACDALTRRAVLLNGLWENLADQNCAAKQTVQHECDLDGLTSWQILQAAGDPKYWHTPELLALALRTMAEPLHSQNRNPEHGPVFTLPPVAVAVVYPGTTVFEDRMRGLAAELDRG